MIRRKDLEEMKSRLESSIDCTDNRVEHIYRQTVANEARIARLESTIEGLLSKLSLKAVSVEAHIEVQDNK